MLILADLPFSCVVSFPKSSCIKAEAVPAGSLIGPAASDQPAPGKVVKGFK